MWYLVYLRYFLSQKRDYATSSIYYQFKSYLISIFLVQLPLTKKGATWLRYLIGKFTFCYILEPYALGLFNFISYQYVCSRYVLLILPKYHQITFIAWKAVLST